jgi:hypothetical protein
MAPVATPGKAEHDRLRERWLTFVCLVLTNHKLLTIIFKGEHNAS